MLAEISRVTVTETAKPAPPGNHCFQVNAQPAGISGAQTRSQLPVCTCSGCSLELDFVFNDLRQTTDQISLPASDKRQTVIARGAAEGETMEKVNNIISRITIQNYVEILISQDQNGCAKVLQGLKNLSKEPGKYSADHPRR